MFDFVVLIANCVSAVLWQFATFTGHSLGLGYVVLRALLSLCRPFDILSRIIRERKTFTDETSFQNVFTRYITLSFHSILYFAIKTFFVMDALVHLQKLEVITAFQ